MSTTSEVDECSECGMEFPLSELKKGGLTGGTLMCHSCRTCAAEGCDERNDDGEGYDGYCGNCADRLEAEGHWD